MTYKETIKKSMEMLAQDAKAVFIGYNIKYGSKVYGTLADIPDSKKLETPVAENLMTGLAMGMALEGFKPVLIFERHDFMLNALDALVNHLDKIRKMSDGEFKAPVIVRAIAGSKKPLYPGPQHIQDFTEAFKKMLSFPVYELRTSEEITRAYESARSFSTPVMLVDRRELYDQDV